MSNAGYRVRPRKGDVKAKQLRKEKIIPGILYGGAYSESVMIEMDQNELIKLMRENSYSSSIPLEGLDGKVNVIIKEIQSDSMTGLPQHFDFQAISKDEVMTFAIPVKIIGEEELSPLDHAYLSFGNRLEQEFFNQGEHEDRTIEQTLDLGWSILKELPREELTRIKPEFIEKYLGKENA